jgi:hypothetical protein
MEGNGVEVRDEVAMKLVGGTLAETAVLVA